MRAQLRPAGLFPALRCPPASPAGPLPDGCSLNYYPFHIGDYLVHTAHLGCMEDIAYRRLIDLYYLREAPIPDGEAARLVRMLDHADVVDAVLREFFVLDDGVWRHGRCDEEIAKMADKRDKAKASAAASWASRNQGVEANAKRTHSERKAMAMLPTPIPIPVLRDVPTVQVVSAAPKRPAIPVQEIIDSYHELLPMCPQVRKLTSARRAQIEARWRSGDLPDVETWREYFAFCATSKFLTGLSAAGPGQRPFVADLEWLSKEANYTKVFERKYHR